MYGRGRKIHKLIVLVEKELQQEIESTVSLIDEVTALYPQMHVSLPLDHIKPDEFILI